jgi:hypothetical protein
LTHDEVAPPSREVVTATFAARECFNGQGRSCNWPPPTLQGPPSTALMLHAQQPLLRRAAVLLHKSPGVATSVRRLAHATATSGCRHCYMRLQTLLHQLVAVATCARRPVAVATSARRPCYMWPPSGPSPLLHQPAGLATSVRRYCYMRPEPLLLVPPPLLQATGVRDHLLRRRCDGILSGDMTASSPTTSMSHSHF